MTVLDCTVLGCTALGWRGKAVTLLILLLTSGSLSAQTLTGELTQEPPAKLILQSQESGDIVRGAILFHQGNIACAKCHRPVNENDRIGPDLSRLEKDVTDESIVDSILQPSKDIKKEYQTSNILRSDGRILTGVIMKQDDDAIVLRDAKNVDKFITIKRDDIDEVLPGSTSMMPDGLVDQLKGRQQFLDLLRYVLDVKQRGPNAEAPNPSTLVRRELSTELSGRVLLRKFNCSACHQAEDDDRQWLSTSAPNLRWSAKNLNPAYLAKFVAEPLQMKHGTAMPQMMPHLDPAVRSQSATAIVAYLVSLDGNGFHQSTDATLDRSAVARGSELFHSVGCVACHSPRNDQDVEQPLNGSIPLGKLAGKYSVSALTGLLENPHVARPNGRMPNMRLTHREAGNIASYLLQAKEEVTEDDSALVTANRSLIAQGKSLFKSLNCAQCHAVVDPSIPVQPASLAMAELNIEQGCLASDTSERAPRFNLTDAERSQIRAALSEDTPAPSKEQTIELNLAHFNCTACHDRNSLGGVTSDRRLHFQTTNLNLGEQGRIPPTLTGVGAKLKSKWMRDVLVNGRSVRPYMKTRMPQYGEQNVGHLVELFQSTDKLQETEFAEFENQKEMRELGLHLAGNKGLNCVACHTYQFKISDTMPAVDLTEMTERLKRDWFYQYMLSPQKFSPNTVMPSFWPGGKAIRPDIAGTPEHQVETLWQYLIDGRQARAPQGVIREPLEIVVTDEARMLRRSYPGMEKRGIGVGYPGGVNLAFDAEQMRLATVWKGQFVDPSGVWYGQGHGKVRPMGKTISLAAGPELDDVKSPWVVDDGRPPSHQFRGYTLDEIRRPTFRYSFENINVEDFYSELNDAETHRVGLRRRVKLVASESSQPMSFRLWAGDGIKLSKDGKQVNVGRIRIQIVSDHAAEMADRSESKQAVVPFTFQAGDVQELILEYRWE